jgi:hypothetical protein
VRPRVIGGYTRSECHVPGTAAGASPPTVRTSGAPARSPSS